MPPSRTPRAKRPVEYSILTTATLCTLAVGAVMVAMSARYLGPLLNRSLPLAEKLAVSDQFRHRQLIILIAMAVPLARL